MATDWIKFDIATFDKPEVISMADQLAMPETHVVGCLIKIWCWFDSHTEDGNAAGVTHLFIDRKTGVKGFAEAMEKVGWLKIKANSIAMPGFDTHNGKSARKRAVTNRRIAKHRAEKCNADGVTESVQKALPEKSKNIKKRLTNVSPKEKTKKVATLVPALWVPDTALADWFAEQGFEFNIADMTRQFVDGCHAKGLKYVDHRAAFRNWSKNRHERQQATNGGGAAGESRAKRHHDKLREIAERSLAEERARETEGGSIT